MDDEIDAPLNDLATISWGRVTPAVERLAEMGWLAVGFVGLGTNCRFSCTE
jgi:hypothetical protein